MSSLPRLSLQAGRAARPGPLAPLAPAAPAWLTRWILRDVLRRVGVRVIRTDGSVFAPGSGAGPDQPTLVVYREAELLARLGAHPKIGLGEGYTAGDWGAAAGTDLADALRPFAEGMRRAFPPALWRARSLVDRAIPEAHRNTVSGARNNISSHYDLGNELFEAFLDPSLTYSSALFDPTRPMAEQDLQEAQLRKIDAALDAAGVPAGGGSPDHDEPGPSEFHLLEIGTGWGSLAIRAAQRGARVTTVTLSREQAVLARQRAAAAGVQHSVDVQIADYRQVSGSFDGVVSIEMIEAVGEEYWPTYLRVLQDRLAPGGRAVVQAILMDHDRYLATRHSFGWIQKHIFQGGLIPSLEALEQVAAAHTGLRQVQVRRFGPDYAETLRRWRQRFTAISHRRLREWGFADDFARTWEFYLAYSEAGFGSGYLDVAQITWTAPAPDQGSPA
ncbi:MAG: class I SAM-dependent methyltransferase [Austwickia sp.]|nr:class I SAM-dependent methyltransferase [Austwickia sp.]